MLQFDWLKIFELDCQKKCSAIFLLELKRVDETILTFMSFLLISASTQENKSEQALQIIGHVVAESYANKRSMHGRRQIVISNPTL
jgi:hypothetical protein